MSLYKTIIFKPSYEFSVFKVLVKYLVLSLKKWQREMFVSSIHIPPFITCQNSHKLHKINIDIHQH